MKLLVTLQGNDKPVEVESTNPDRIKWDLAAAKYKWPSLQDAPFLGMSFIAWSALTRTGKYSGTWTAFSETDCVEVEAVDDDDEGVDPSL